MRQFDLHNIATPPSPCRVARTLMLVGGLLGTSECFHHASRFHYPLGAGWSIAIRPESADRFRIDACKLSRPVSTLWSLDGEDAHLAGVVLELAALIRSDEKSLEGDCRT